MLVDMKLPFVLRFVVRRLFNHFQCCQCASACLAPRGCVSRPKRTLSRPKFLNRGFWGLNGFCLHFRYYFACSKKILALSLEARSKTMDQRYSWFWPNLIDVTGNENRPSGNTEPSSVTSDFCFSAQNFPVPAVNLLHKNALIHGTYIIGAHLEPKVL